MEPQASRSPNPGPPIRRLDGLQALRGVAAIAVVVRHALSETGVETWLTALGAAGVDVFFVISGFVMAYSSGGLSARTFLARRIARVVPLYWLCTLMLVALAASHFAYQSLDISPRRVLASLAFVEDDPVIFVGWSLNYEMFFYLVFAAMIGLGLYRWRGLVIPLVMLGCVASGLPVIGRSLVLEFGYGVLLALAYSRGLSGRWALPAGVLGLALLVSVCAVHKLSPDGVRWLWWGVPALLLVYAGLYWKPRFTLFGDASYSIYLIHVPVMTVLAKLLKQGLAPSWAGVPAAVLVSLALGVLLYWTVEGPLHRRTSAYLRDRSAIRPTAAGEPAALPRLPYDGKDSR